MAGGRMICDNPKCQYYKPLPPALPRNIGHVEVVVNPSAMFNFEVKTVARYLWVGIGGWTGFDKYLCGACNNAVEMVRRG